MTLRLEPLLSSKLLYHLLTMELSFLGNHGQIYKKTMKNQDENKIRSNEFSEFIPYITNLIGSLYISHFPLSNTYIFDPKREYNQFRL